MNADETEILESEEKSWQGPLKIIGALLLILLIIIMVVPHYGIKYNPEPKNIPTYDEIFTEMPSVKNTTEHSVYSKEDFQKFMKPNNPYIKTSADKISTQSCRDNRICYAKAIFYFIRDEFNYINDPRNIEYVKTAEETIISRGGDCDDLSVLLANMLESIGIETEFVFVPQHVFIKIKLNEALNKYKDDEGWIYLDPACSYCSFGEMSLSSFKNIK